MEEKSSKESGKFSERRSSGESRRTSDIRHLWSTATLSQQQLNLPLPTVAESCDMEDDSPSPKAQGFLGQTADLGSDTARNELDEGGNATPGDKDSVPQEAMDQNILLGLGLHRSSSLGSNLEEGDGVSKTETESSFSLSKHTPHRAYWAEQQNRLPLPLTELMEKEALEILTRALHSYRSGIGWDHLLTKQLQRHVEGLKRRRNKRLNILLN